MASNKSTGPGRVSKALKNRADRNAPFPWWRGASIYQIYPRSFLDSNGDGIGDLRGCIKSLDHVASLGVDAVWLSPFFTSPMDDFGYDVADFCDVDPIFGDLSDFDALIERAHDLGLKLIIDQVYSHSSDQHPWFQESRRDRENPKADWYVWADPKPDGGAPNNWQSVFGGGAWQWDEARRQFYLHNFLNSQPDLNLHNPAVQDAMLDVTRFWLNRGVDGFRLDAINFAMHDPQLRDNPPARNAPPDAAREYVLQEHRFNQSQPEIVAFLERIRGVTDEFGDAFTVAEIGGLDAFGEMKTFTQGDRRLNSAYSFEFLYADQLSAALVKNVLQGWGEQDGWPSWAFSNHDAPRVISRWAGDAPPQNYARFAILLLAALRGNIFIYQGEELGLEQADIPFDKLQDPEAIRNWPETLGRDGARTPLPWHGEKPHAGFSDTDPWLPIDPRHIDCAIDRQEDDPQSILNFARRVITFRNNSPALRLGELSFLPSPENIVAFTRRHEGETMLCVFNCSERTETFTPPDVGARRIVISANVKAIDGDRVPDSLAPASGYVAQKGVKLSVAGSAVRLPLPS